MKASVNFEVYWLEVRQLLPWLILISLGVSLLAYVMVEQKGVYHEVHFSYLVALREREGGSEDFRFDGYFALQATDLFAATLAELISSPETIAASFQAAGLPLPTDAGQLARQVTAEKTASQVVQVVVRDPDAARAEALAGAVQATVADKLTTLDAHGIPALRFEATPTNPWVGVARLSTSVIVSATFLVTFFVLINLVIVRKSLQYLNA